jgi:fatty acyl-CoA reductase
LQLFGKLKDQMPKFRHKVVIINGDCSLPGLGLETSDRRLLIEDISHVFHGAATVRFDENLRSALATNVVGTRSVLELAREMKKLKVPSTIMPLLKLKDAFTSGLITTTFVLKRILLKL